MADQRLQRAQRGDQLGPREVLQREGEDAQQVADLSLGGRGLVGPDGFGLQEGRGEEEPFVPELQ